MTHSPSLRFFNNFKSGKGDKKRKDETLTDTVGPATQVSRNTNPQSTVQGWLKSVRSYGQTVAKSPSFAPVDVDSHSTLIDNDQTDILNHRPASIASEDSVNLDDLINANYTADVDNETDLPDLGDLDIADSKDEFWKLDKRKFSTDLTDTFSQYLSDKSMVDEFDLDWNPDNVTTTAFRTSLPEIPPSDYSLRNQRSSSMSSDSSSNPQNTINQYAKYGLTPVNYPSESSSTSSRSLSRQSNYSTSSSNTTPNVPHSRANSSVHTIPSPSRSHSTRESNTPTLKNASYLTSTKISSNRQGSVMHTPSKRASHIPAPATRTMAPPSPQRTTSTNLTNNKSIIGNSRLKTSQLPTTNSAMNMQRRLPQRASHIPTIRESIHRPGSPLHYTPAASSTVRVNLRSPTPGSEGIRNSIFSVNETGLQSAPTAGNRIGNGRRSMTPTSMKSSGLRPPTTTPGLLNGSSLPSRIGSHRK